MLFQGCTVAPLVTWTSPDYPNLAVNDRAEIAISLSSSGRRPESYKNLMDAVLLAEDKKDLTVGQAKGVSVILAALQRDRETAAKQIEARASEEKARKNIDAENRAASQKQSDVDTMARRYRQDYQNISSPDDAARFIATYKGSYDPENLTPGAMKKGYDTAVLSTQRCITWANREIAAQKEIGATAGVVNKNNLYMAGVSLLQCRRQLAQYKANPVK